MAGFEHKQLAYNVKELAPLIGIPARTLCELCATGKIRARKAGRRWTISARAIDDYLDVHNDRLGPEIPADTTTTMMTPFRRF